VAGALAFRWVTRPVRKLTAQIAKLDDGGLTTSCEGETADARNTEDDPADGDLPTIEDGAE
jgi:hypothetical protein